jgi:hypothetical protein
VISDPMTRDLYVAFHEAAHLVAAIKLGLPVVSATIVPNGHGIAGGVRLADSASSAAAEDRATASLAGLAASEILLGGVITQIPPDQLAAKTDVINAASIIKGLVSGDDEQEHLFFDLTDRATALLIEDRGLWNRLASALVAARTMEWADIEDVICEHDE